MKLKPKATIKKEDTRLKYKKESGGIHFHSDGQVVKKGEILYAHPHELSDVVKAGFTCLSNEPSYNDMPSMKLQIKARGNGWYDIVDSTTGNVLNERALRPEEAKAFLEGEELPDKKEDKKVEEEEIEEEDDEDTEVED